MTEQSVSHAELMDTNYRYQRFIYDLTRKYFLLGRDHLIANLAPPSEGRVLELACGTGRNLALISRRYPGCRLFGLDISEQMLRSARAKLSSRARLACADAASFDGAQIFNVGGFERIVLSYSLSMIPAWQEAIGNALDHVAPGGELHIVDFGTQARLPGWFSAGLRAHLRAFHVAPRDDLLTVLDGLAADGGCRVHWTPLLRDYAQYAVLLKHVR